MGYLIEIITGKEFLKEYGGVSYDLGAWDL